MIPVLAAQTGLPVLEARSLSVVFGGRGGMSTLHALSDVSFALRAGRGLALVGESGSGKSTCAKVLMGLQPPTSGSIFHHGADVTLYTGRDARLKYLRQVQMVFQDPFAALNPAHRILHHLDRPLALHRPDIELADRRDAIVALVRSVDLDPDRVLDKFPHELSGGQRQRVNLARALAVGPEVLIADEPTSMLDVSIRLSVLDTFCRLKDEKGIALFYITHDIATARYVAEETAVIYGGRIVEMGPTAEVIDSPRHPYTRLLLDAVPEAGRRFGDGGKVSAEADRVRQLSRAPGELRDIGGGHWVRDCPIPLTA